jgi:hypothetical protein
VDCPGRKVADELLGEELTEQIDPALAPDLRINHPHNLGVCCLEQILTALFRPRGSVLVHELPAIGSL